MNLQKLIDKQEPYDTAPVPDFKSRLNATFQMTLFQIKSRKMFAAPPDLVVAG